MEYIFWASLAVAAYAYLGYPILVWLLSAVFRRRTMASAEASAADLPYVSLLIAAHCEENWIAERIRNALAMDYPAERLEIVVASDGSRDRTNDIVRQFVGAPGGTAGAAPGSDRVRLFDYEQNRGKSTVLNCTFPQTRGDVIVFSDANTMFEPQALRNLLAGFADPKVGVVCGKLVLHDPQSGKNADGLYWRYETFLKVCEGRLGALLGANGAIYAIRRSLFVPIPSNTIIDDFTIPLLAKLHHDCSIVYRESAVAHEDTPPTIKDEFWRRARIGAGAYQSLSLLYGLLNPRHGWTAFTFFNHKLLRWLVPFLLPIIFVANVALIRNGFYQVILALQLSFYALALVGNWLPANALPIKIARLCSMFCGMNAALLVGFYRWAFVAQQGVWKRTAREEATSASS